jgi:2-keto-4-pentenoate hydratase
VGEAALIADNACANWLCIGPPAPEIWRDRDLATLTPRCRILARDMSLRSDTSGLGANVLGHPRVAMTWAVNEITGLGIPLRKGQIISTGTCLPPPAIEPGDHVTGDFGALGQVELFMGRS